MGVAFATIAKRCLIADFCGAGKTVESIGTDLKLRSLGHVRRTLVVCLSDKRMDWVDEYRRFTDLEVTMIDGPKQGRTQQWLYSASDMGVTVASYEQIRADMCNRIKDDFGHKHNEPTGLLRHLHYDLIVFDEASVFRTWDSTLADSLRFLIGQCKPYSALALTATPINKRAEDVVSIMDKVVPGLFDYQGFLHRYVVTKRFRKGRFSFTKVVGYRNLDELSDIMDPFFIRRERDKVYGDTTKRVRKVRTVSLSAEQQKLYNNLRSQASDGAERQDLLAIYRQMEYAVDTMAYTDENDHTSSKLDDLMHLLDTELQDEQVLIFSNRHKTLDELRIRLEKSGILYINYTGREDIKSREADRQRFLVDPSLKCALITTAAEMGKNFHSARYVIFLNHVVNPARIDQVIGRIDRGHMQKSNFICSIHYVCKDTHEVSLLNKIEKERKTSEQVFNIKDDSVELMTDDHLLDLIRTGKFPDD